MVEHGKLLWKQTLASLNDDKVRHPGYPVNQYNADYHPQNVLAKAVRYFLLALLLLLIVNRAYLFYRLFRKKNAKSTSQTEEPAEQSEEQPAEEPQSQNSPAEAENCDKDS